MTAHDGRHPHAARFTRTRDAKQPTDSRDSLLAGVFKTRGAFDRILSGRETGTLDPASAIVAASGGNAGLANAYAAADVGVPGTVFVP